MRTGILFASAILLCAPTLDAQDWRAQLTRDLVQIVDGKMVFQQVGLVKIEIPGYEVARFQVRTRSEAPARGASTFVQRKVFRSSS